MGKSCTFDLKQRSRGWCWTVNNWTGDDLVDVILLSDYTQYLVCGFETAPTTGTPHLQCYCFFKDQKTGKRFSEFFSRKHHIEKAKGSPEENRNYCYGNVEGKKPNFDVFEMGQVPISGRITMEHLDVCMRQPQENIQVFHQYRKTYDELVNIRRKNDHTTTAFSVVDDQFFTSGDFYSKLFDVLDNSKHSVKECAKKEHGDCYVNSFNIFMKRVAVVSDLSELELYNDYDIVILTQLLLSEHHRMRLWFGGHLPLYYNYGYMKKIIKPKNLIVVSDNITHEVFDGFKIINFETEDGYEVDTPSLTEMSSDSNN